MTLMTEAIHWIQELFKPLLKCDRYGCRIRPHILKGVRHHDDKNDGHMFRCALHGFKARVGACVRCGEIDSDLEMEPLSRGHCYQSVSLPSAEWEAIAERGYSADSLELEK